MLSIIDIKEIVKAKFLRSCSELVGNPSAIADDIVNNKTSWNEAVRVYLALYSLSIFIYQTILSKHTTMSLSVLEFAVFQIIYIFIATAIIRLAWLAVGGVASYVMTFKFSLYVFGLIYVFNSILFPFDLYKDAGGNRLIVLIAASVVIYWTLKAWSAYGNLNNCNSFLKKSIAFMVAAVLFTISPFVLSVLTKYFAILT
jgi:hypothetical protein